MNTPLMKAVIVDDEPKVSKALEYELNLNFPDVEVVAVARNVKDAVNKIRRFEPDVVFLDILLPGESGFDLLKHFDDIRFELIFVTSHAEFALNAIRVSALAYLLKPVQTDELKSALDQVRNRKLLNDSFMSYRVLIDNMEKDSMGEQRIAINNQRETVFAKIKDILFCEGWDRYTKIHLKGRKELLSSYNIGKYKSMLEPFSFVLTHRSYLVNPMHVLSLTSDDKLNLIDGFSIPVAQRKRTEVIGLIKEGKK
jgi:two-component system LytT family response regulator